MKWTNFFQNADSIINHQNSPFLFLKIEIKNFSITKTLGLNGFVNDAYQIFEEEIISLINFQENRGGRGNTFQFILQGQKNFATKS